MTSINALQFVLIAFALGHSLPSRAAALFVARDDVALGQSSVPGQAVESDQVAGDEASEPDDVVATEAAEQEVVAADQAAAPADTATAAQLDASPVGSQQIVHVSVTAIEEGGLVLVGDRPIDRPTLLKRNPLEVFETPEDGPLLVAFTEESQPERSRAMIRVRESGTVVMTDRASVEFRWREGVYAGIAAHEPTLSGAPSPMGSRVEIYQVLAAPAVTLVSVPGAQLLVSSASLLLEREEGGIRVSINSGEVTVFPGPLPGEGVAALTRGITLRATAENSVLVTAGEISPATRVERAAPSTLLAGGTVVRESLVQELYAVAETVAEGDIQPPTRGAGIGPIAVAPFARIPEIVPRGTAATQVLVGAQTAVVSQALSTAESFLSQGNAALAVVGARLERTRIIGNTSGVAAQGPLSISGNLQRPFTIRTGP